MEEIMQLRWLVKRYPKASMQQIKDYRDKYGFNACKLTLAKDPSDAVKYFGKEKTLVNLVPSIHNALYVDL